MTKTIVYETWIKEPDKSAEAAKFILEHFDVTQLKRGKRAPGRARMRHRKGRPPR